ncbi:MAG: Fe-S oxidoreductase [Gammaproteobacteria bacterium]|nr:MAG: Fe-S oxidoreductase [Gammaproteobacteria bacterium]
MKPATDLTNFQCIQCHACCKEKGYVRLTAEDTLAIAGFLNMDVWSFTDSFTRLIHDRTGLSLTEKPNGECIFLTEKGCAINPVKPSQCKDFPWKWRFSSFERICGWAKGQRSSAE